MPLCAVDAPNPKVLIASVDFSDSILPIRTADIIDFAFITPSPRHPVTAIPQLPQRQPRLARLIPGRFGVAIDNAAFVAFAQQ